jgi:hypothetical protein
MNSRPSLSKKESHRSSISNFANLLGSDKKKPVDECTREASVTKRVRPLDLNLQGVTEEVCLFGGFAYLFVLVLPKGRLFF